MLHRHHVVDRDELMYEPRYWQPELRGFGSSRGGACVLAVEISERLSTRWASLAKSPLPF